MSNARSLVTAFLVGCSSCNAQLVEAERGLSIGEATCAQVLREALARQPDSLTLRSVRSPPGRWCSPQGEAKPLVWMVLRGVNDANSNSHAPPGGRFWEKDIGTIAADRAGARPPESACAQAWCLSLGQRASMDSLSDRHRTNRCVHLASDGRSGSPRLPSRRPAACAAATPLRFGGALA